MTPLNPARRHVLLVGKNAKRLARSIEKRIGTVACLLTPALSAERALRIAATFRFDVLVSDLDLGDRNGHWLLAELNRLYPICGICLAERGEQAHEPRWRAAGFVSCFARPLNLAELSRELSSDPQRIYNLPA